MPIISRTLRHVRPQRDGTVRVQEHLVDSHGRDWFYSYRVGSEAEAQARMDARDLTEQLEDAEEADAVAFIEAGGDPAVFSRIDLTAAQYNRRIAKRFANARLQDDRTFICAVASWAAGFTANQISNSLGILLPRATAILNRAIDLRDNVCPALVADDVLVEDID